MLVYCVFINTLNEKGRALPFPASCGCSQCSYVWKVPSRCGRWCGCHWERHSPALSPAHMLMIGAGQEVSNDTRCSPAAVQHVGGGITVTYLQVEPAATWSGQPGTAPSRAFRSTSVRPGKRRCCQQQFSSLCAAPMLGSIQLGTQSFDKCSSERSSNDLAVGFLYIRIHFLLRGVFDLPLFWRVHACYIRLNTTQYKNVMPQMQPLKRPDTILYSSENCTILWEENRCAKMSWKTATKTYTLRSFDPYFAPVRSVCICLGSMNVNRHTADLYQTFI